MFSVRNSSDLFRIVDGVHFIEKNGSYLVLSHDRKGVIELNKVAYSIWSNLQKPISFTNLLAKLQEEYDVKQEELTKDIEDWLKEALKEKIIKKVKST